MLDLSGLLVPEKTGEGLYRGPTGPSFGSRLFGGQAFAQALMAGSLAERDGRLAHSAHAYFLKAGAAADPMDLAVTPLTEGLVAFVTRFAQAESKRWAEMGLSLSVEHAHSGE